MGRPIGVTILCAFMITAGLGFAALGFIFFFMGSSGAAVTSSTHGVLATALAATGAAAGVIFLLFGGFHIVLAIGIFKLRDMARVFTIFLFLLIGLGACLGSVAAMLSNSHVALAWNLFLLALDALALWYLFRQQTKAAFHG